MNPDILHVANTCYPAQLGGIDNALYWYAYGQKKAGARVRIVCTDQGQPESTTANEWQNTKFGRVLYVATHFWYAPVRFALVANYQVLKHRGIVHIHGPLYCSLLLPSLAVHRGGIIASLHGELDEYARSTGTVWAKNLVFRAYRLLKGRIHYHATCETEVQNVRKVMQPRLPVIREGIGMLFPELLRHQPDYPYLSYIGRINHIKGIDRLIKAVATSDIFLKGTFKLLIAGGKNTPEYSELRDLVAEKKLSNKIKFVGIVGGLEKERFLANAYMNIMPSHTENFGVVTLEALAQGTPAVASVHTPWNILEKEGVGFQTEITVDALRATIDKILKLDRTTYFGMRDKARGVAQANFDAEVVGNRWLTHYAKVNERTNE